jgi:tRNA A-37 threonylcarbamoyl transferase component Bud32
LRKLQASKLITHNGDVKTVTVYIQLNNQVEKREVEKRFRMNRIIQQLKEQRIKAEQTFIKNSFIKRSCKINTPCPDTDADLDVIGELNQAISILENYRAAKEPVSNCV